MSVTVGRFEADASYRALTTSSGHHCKTSAQCSQQRYRDTNHLYIGTNYRNRFHYLKLKSVVRKRNLLSCLKFYTTKLKTYSAYPNTKFQYYESNSLLQLGIYYPAKLLGLAHTRCIKINSVLCLFTNIYPETIYKL